MKPISNRQGEVRAIEPSRTGFAVRSALRLHTVTPAQRKEREGQIHHLIAPCLSDTPYVLILGTFPSPKSRSFNFFYGHPQNRFWKVLAALFDAPVPQTRDERIAFVKSHHLALWDTVASCEITGASDTSIKNVVPNPVWELTKAYGIRAVFTTGKKAGQLYQKYIEPKNHLPAVVLPSTSPANCAMSLEKLIAAYAPIREAVLAGEARATEKEA